MLEPRETDIPALFLVFVVLPLVTYILLGKWSESSKKKERISLLAQQAAEEALRVEAMAAASVIPPFPLPNNSMHQCARCCGPATTRCSQCKAAWYCSGKCQILHWREFHKHECQQLHRISGSSLPKSALVEEFPEKVSFDGKIDTQSFEYNANQTMLESTPSEIHSPVCSLPSAAAASMKADNSVVTVTERKSIDKRPSQKGIRDSSNGGGRHLSECSNQASVSGAMSAPLSLNTPPQEVSARHKVRENDSFWSDSDVNIPAGVNRTHASSRNMLHESHMLQRQSKHVYATRNSCAASGSSNVVNNGTDLCNIQSEASDEENLQKKEISPHDESTGTYASTESAPMKRSNQVKSTSHSLGTKLQKSPKSMVKASREHCCLDCDQKGATANELKITRSKDAVPSQGKDGLTAMGIKKMIGLMKPTRLDRQEIKEVNANGHKKIKMLFPYEEFVKFFQSEVFDMFPRGLINCGNSCYANAVLQCLSCTKPLTVFLLRRSHSTACCARDWCLICELEQHVMMLREIGGPLSPSRILSHMRTINCQIGDGSQEDAHEFLRLLVASMQSICLESLGGENMVDPRLQETTFIQHTFGGRLRSKVKCLRCHHESERSENIMDLTLEIFGWVESLEDALTQFTSPEDLDGENMYRCGRCATYVRARKQLSIQEAPNILTIVLKRFQEGSYGKINKCISFPDMLDMVPFMTGTDDIPPLYMLYAVVVHLDTLNASFSGHYISYVKDPQGNWLRIDDTQVQAVEMSQVMSEGAYILFYMRSSPRPARSSRKATCQQAPVIAKHWPSRSQKSSRTEQDRSNHHFVDSECPSDYKWSRSFTNLLSGGMHRSANGTTLPTRETYARSISTEFSDATSSDWSIFTSSDEASFTTESTRDSFSTVDYADAGNIDPISSMFNTLYASEYPPHKTIACSMFSTSKPATRFFSENKGSVVECYLPDPPLNRVSRGKNSREATVSPSEAFHHDTTCDLQVRCGSGTRFGLPLTCVNCNI